MLARLLASGAAIEIVGGGPAALASQPVTFARGSFGLDWLTDAGSYAAGDMLSDIFFVF